MRSKLPNVGVSIFSIMSQMANEHNAINLAQGFPDFPIDDTLIHAVEIALKRNAHQYAPMQGNIHLRNAISDLIFKTSFFRFSLEEILVTAGATQAIFTSIQALVAEGDEVILLDPCYDCYETPVFLAGGKAIHVPLQIDYRPDWGLIMRKLNDRTRMLVINSPHNPSGVVWCEEDYNELILITERHPNLIILSDEVYEYITFEKPHISIRGIDALRNKAIVVSSFGKTLHATGWKVGYLTAPLWLMEEIKKVHQFLVFSVNSFVQEALAAYLPPLELGNISRMYLEKRNLFRNLLKTSRFELLPCEGTYFQTLNYSKISDMDDVEFCKWLVQKPGIAAIPISVFNIDRKDQKCIRLCFAKEDQTLINAARILCEI